MHTVPFSRETTKEENQTHSFDGVFILVTSCAYWEKRIKKYPLIKPIKSQLKYHSPVGKYIESRCQSAHENAAHCIVLCFVVVSNQRRKKNYNQD